MKHIGLIAEFNPLHTGHAYILQKIRDRYGSEAVITVIMSGAFVQRGEPALFDKFDRASFALACGADTVFELPAAYALSHADDFASGAVRLAASLGIDTLVCGSEKGTGPEFMEIVKLWRTEKAQDLITAYTKKHIPYGTAVTTALSELDKQAALLLTTPNALLAFTYAKAVQKHSPSMRLDIVRRHMSDTALYTAGSSIRKAVAAGAPPDGYLPYIPPAIAAAVRERIRNGAYTDYGRYEELVLYRGRTAAPGRLKTVAAFTEGLNNRWHLVMSEASSLTEGLERLKTKRYMYSRLCRMAACTVLEVDRADMNEWLESGPAYGRLLGANKKGRTLLKKFRNGKTPQIITKTADAVLTGAAAKMLALDIRAADIQHLCFHNKEARKGRTDYKQMPVIRDL